MLVGDGWWGRATSIGPRNLRVYSVFFRQRAFALPSTPHTSIAAFGLHQLNPDLRRSEGFGCHDLLGMYHARERLHANSTSTGAKGASLGHEV